MCLLCFTNFPGRKQCWSRAWSKALPAPVNAHFLVFIYKWNKWSSTEQTVSAWALDIKSLTYLSGLVKSSRKMQVPDASWAPISFVKIGVWKEGAVLLWRRSWFILQGATWEQAGSDLCLVPAEYRHQASWEQCRELQVLWKGDAWVAVVGVQQLWCALLLTKHLFLKK